MNMDDLLVWLQNTIPKNATVLDVGCGDKWYWKHIQAQFIGIDAFPKFEPDFLLDLNIDNIPDVKVDVALMLDFIEHLPKERGKQLLQQAKEKATVVVVLTPLWWSENTELLNDPKSPYYRNVYNIHQSLWTCEDFLDFERIQTLSLRYYHGIWRA
jgi:hypothetical protein